MISYFQGKIKENSVKKIRNAPMIIYRYICSFIKDNGYPPTVREICQKVGLRSPSSVHAHLKTLQEQGLIMRDSSKQRAYTVVDKDDLLDPVHLLGKVAAGIPINSIENLEDSFPLPDILTQGYPPSETFMLRVQGDSMTGIGMLDGDIIVVAMTQQVVNGNIVVAHVNNEEVTVKRIKMKHDSVVLIPENLDYIPLVISKDHVEIIGKVIGLIRQI
jgi:SOS regulatory protein LexA